MKIKKGDIVLLNLNPTKGSEQKGFRPCIILQNNIYNKYSSTTIILPITTSKNSSKLPTKIFVEKNSFNNLKEDSFVKVDQIRVIDKSRIESRIGIIDYEVMEKIEVALKFLLSLK